MWLDFCSCTCSEASSCSGACARVLTKRMRSMTMSTSKASDRISCSCISTQGSCRSLSPGFYRVIASIISSWNISSVGEVCKARAWRTDRLFAWPKCVSGRKRKMARAAGNNAPSRLSFAEAKSLSVEMYMYSLVLKKDKDVSVNVYVTLCGLACILCVCSASSQRF